MAALAGLAFSFGLVVAVVEFVQRLVSSPRVRLAVFIGVDVVVVTSIIFAASIDLNIGARGAIIVGLGFGFLVSNVRLRAAFDASYRTKR